MGLHAPAEDECTNYDLILPSQLRPNSRVRVETDDGYYYLFETVGNRKVKCLTTNNPDGYLLNWRGQPFVNLPVEVFVGFQGGFHRGEDLQVRSDSLQCSLGKVVAIEGVNIAPDEITPGVVEVLKKYFPTATTKILAVRASEVLRAVLSAPGIVQVAREPAGGIDFVDNSTLHAQVSAAILELIKKIDEGSLDLSLTDLEYIASLFSQFVFDQIDPGGHMVVYRRTFKIDGTHGQKTCKLHAGFLGNMM